MAGSTVRQSASAAAISSPSSSLPSSKTRVFSNSPPLKYFTSAPIARLNRSAPPAILPQSSGRYRPSLSGSDWHCFSRLRNAWGGNSPTSSANIEKIRRIRNSAISSAKPRHSTVRGRRLKAVVQQNEQMDCRLKFSIPTSGCPAQSLKFIKRSCAAKVFIAEP